MGCCWQLFGKKKPTNADRTITETNKNVFVLFLLLSELCFCITSGGSNGKCPSYFGSHDPKTIVSPYFWGRDHCLFSPLIFLFPARTFAEKNVYPGLLILSNPIQACSGVDAAVQGKIVLVERGACTFTQKIQLMKDAGAVAVCCTYVSDVRRLPKNQKTPPLF